MLLMFVFFFFNDTATTEIYTLSLHDALPISPIPFDRDGARDVIYHQHVGVYAYTREALDRWIWLARSEEHTSELQSQSNLVCRLLLEKKKKIDTRHSAQLNTNGDTHSLRCVT